MMAQYIEQTEQLEKDALKVRANSPEWKYLKTQSNVMMFWKASPHFNGNIYKFKTELDLPHDVVYEVMKPPKTTEERLAWDKSLKHYERLQTITEDIAIGYLSTPAMLLGVVSSREFVDLYLFKTFDKDQLNEDYGTTSWIFAKSVDYPSRPQAPDAVRGINYPGGFSVSQSIQNPDKCYVEMYVNSSIGGSLPRKIVEAALPSQQVSYVESVKAEVKRRIS